MQTAFDFNTQTGFNQYIDLDTFVTRMEQHWTEELENVSSPALRAAWRQIAAVFKAHIMDHDKPEGSRRWNVLSPPTGSGKTESSIIYCAMLADLDDFFHPGALIITRLIDDCDRIAERINQYGSRETAIAFHSKAKVKLTALASYPVVVITHRAYEQALDHLGGHGEIRQTWPFFHNRSGGDTRRLIIVDECLDIVEHSKAGLDGLRQTLGAIPQFMRERFPQEVNALQSVIRDFETMAEKAKQAAARETMLVKAPLHERGLVPEEALPDMSPLVQALDDIRFDWKDQTANNRQRETHRKRLKALHYTFRSWIYYGKYKADHTMNTARLLIPEGVKGAVVMDATASTNIVYDLHKDSHRLISPEGVRDYRNVTMHISKGHNIGKNTMTKEAKQITSDLMQSLNPILRDRKALIICHKDVESVLQKYETTFELQTGHWGAIDGSNEWRDCDTAVVFGLPYLPDTWTANVFMALQGPQGTEWLRSDGDRPFGDHQDIRKALKWGQLSTSIIQAINRVRCRKVVDEQGNCPKTDIYMLLPKGNAAEAVLNDIRQAMPGIKVVENWKFKKNAKKARGSKFEPALVKFMENLSTGSKLPMSAVGRRLGTSPKVLQTLTAKLKDTSSNLCKAMTEARARLEVSGEGRGSRVYLVKD